MCNKEIIRYLLATLLLVPVVSHAKCFSYKVTDLATTGVAHLAQVLEIKDFGSEQCTLKLDFKSVTITATSRDTQLCSTKVGSEIFARVHTSCCHVGNCGEQNGSRIWFTKE